MQVTARRHQTRRKTQRGLEDDLGLRGLLHRLDLPLHRLESGSEHGGGQLGYVLAVADSGLNAFLDQPLLQFHELRRLFTTASDCIAAVRFLAFFAANS